MLTYGLNLIVPVLIFSILFLILSNAVTLRRDKSILFCRVGLSILLYSAYEGYNVLETNTLGRGIGLLGGLFHATLTTQVFGIFICIIATLILQICAFYPRKVIFEEYLSMGSVFLCNISYYNTKIVNKMGGQYKIIEYTLILIFILSGALFLISTSDLVSVFLSIELQSYGLYLLSTIYRNSELATTGGLTYFLLGGLSSSFILLGSSLLYANSGTTILDGIYIITSISEFTVGDLISQFISNWYSSDYLNFSLLIMSVGFLFKISAAPFHFWSPGVYDAIPTIVTTFVAIIPKISILIFFLELVHYTSNTFFAFTYNWTTSLLVSALLSLIIGAVLGLTQSRIKRLLAYSTISHLGFILLALSIHTIESIQAFIFYLMQYTITNLNAFIILIAIGFSLHYYVNDKQEYKELEDKNNSPIQLNDQLKGYFYINPFLALSLTITLFSFVGVPPLMGFFAKQMVLSAALDSGYVFMALVAILTSVISAVYYLNIVKQVFFDKPEHIMNPELEKENIEIDASIIYPSGRAAALPLSGTKQNNLLEHSSNITIQKENIVLSSSLTTTISVLTIIILLFIFDTDLWLRLANLIAINIFNT